MRIRTVTMIVLLAGLVGLTGCSGGSTLTPPGKADAATSAAGRGGPKEGVTGQGAGQAEDEVRGTVRFVTNRVDLVNDGTYDKYEAAFKMRYPAVNDVVFEPIANYESDIRIRLTTGEAQDVLLIPGNIAQSNLGDFFEPLNDLAGELGDLYFKDIRAYQGNTYGIVSGVSTEGVVYNKHAFAKAGIDEVPQTLDAFYEACRKLKAAGMIPMYINYGAQWPMKQWGEGLASYMSGSPDYLNNMSGTDTPFRIDNAFGQALGIVRTLIQRGYVEKDLSSNLWEASKLEVASGQAGMYFLGNWIIPQLVSAGAFSGDIGYFPMPYDNSGRYYAPLNADWFYAISKSSPNKAAAKAWIRFMVEDSGFAESAGFIPPQKNRQPTLPQLDEFKSYHPTFVETVATSGEWNAIGNKAKIDFWSGGYIQKLVAAPDLKAAFDELNARWAAARRQVQQQTP
ncbi:carbohydrate ABC transporter substrate-binding protein [Paenibacillus athensensis]|uniref:ABC transporter substrate-binding protein n=1 Tax=Paenibacillus athensensis TaxID=1967502 RepID=A0A4Y8QAI6_9BACL|nr:ABC transporter substrate-binding protein [Paenibacillus athensensis]MCD1258961.1 carbohydrate ABC transporter substrate-binding protein [Paenibacillus athensensis]